MPLFVDAYRPTSLDALHYHHDLSSQIKALAGTGQDFPHLLVYGPSGAGKKTRIMCTLKELFGKGVEKVRSRMKHAFSLTSCCIRFGVEQLRIDQRVFLTPTKRKLDVNVVQSNYHIELTPSCVCSFGLESCTNTAIVTSAYGTGM